MAEIDNLVDYYQNLLIMQYHDLPRAMDTIGDVSRETLSDMVWKAVRDCFDYQTAIGIQLDILGRYVGALRKTEDSSDLSDSDLRFLIKMKAIKNSTDNSMKSIDDYMWQFFGNTVNVVNNGDMSMTYQFSAFHASIMNFAEQTDSLPRPLSVAIIIEGVTNDNGDFGFSFGGSADADIWGYGFTPLNALITDEADTSISSTEVVPVYGVAGVTGVWLASDPGHVGTNYYVGGSFDGDVITLGTPLPGPSGGLTAVITTYTAYYGGTYLMIF